MLLLCHLYSNLRTEFFLQRWLCRHICYQFFYNSIVIWLFLFQKLLKTCKYMFHVFDNVMYLFDCQKLCITMCCMFFYIFNSLFCYNMNLYFGPAALHYIIYNILSLYHIIVPCIDLVPPCILYHYHCKVIYIACIYKYQFTTIAVIWPSGYCLTHNYSVLNSYFTQSSTFKSPLCINLNSNIVK